MERDVLAKVTHVVLALGLVFLVVEVHNLRVAVEDVGLTSFESPSGQMPASLGQPLDDLGDRLEALTAAFDRSRARGSVDASVSAAPAMGEAKSVTPANDRRREPRARVERVPLAADWEARLAALADTIENIDASPRVIRASLPTSPANAREIQPGAVAETITSVSNSPNERSRHLMSTPQQLVDRYGKPTAIYLGGKDERRRVTWTYELATGSWLNFVLCDGRVLRMDVHR